MSVNTATLVDPSFQTDEAAPLPKLDFGCGPNKKEGFIGVDQFEFDGVDVVMDIAHDAWPWEDGSIGEAHASHFVEHLSGLERVHFFNELYRVLAPGAKVTVITPHWCSTRAYGDFTHQWPPVSEMFYYYLNSDWRNGCEESPGRQAMGANAPHCDIKHNPQGYSCDFLAEWSYGLNGNLSGRSQETVMFAIENYKEACSDTLCTLTCRKSQ